MIMDKGIGSPQGLPNRQRELKLKGGGDWKRSHDPGSQKPEEKTDSGNPYHGQGLRKRMEQPQGVGGSNKGLPR